MTPISTKRPIFANRYVSLLIDATCVTGWALWIFRARTADEVAAAALVVMMAVIFVVEALTRTLPVAATWLGFRLFKDSRSPPEPKRTAASFALSVRIAGMSVVVTLVIFLVCASYGLAFLLSVLMLKVGGLDWATRSAAHVGFGLIGAAISALALAVMTVLGAFLLSVISWAEMATRIYGKTVKALWYVLQLRGVEPESIAVGKAPSSRRERRFGIASH